MFYLRIWLGKGENWRQKHDYFYFLKKTTDCTFKYTTYKVKSLDFLALSLLLEWAKRKLFARILLEHLKSWIWCVCALHRLLCWLFLSWLLPVVFWRFEGWLSYVSYYVSYFGFVPFPALHLSVWWTYSQVSCLCFRCSFVCLFYFKRSYFPPSAAHIWLHSPVDHQFSCLSTLKL